jgi:hypothetical protein
MMCETTRLRLRISLTFIPSLLIVAARLLAQDDPAGTGNEPAQAPATQAPATQAPATQVAAPAGDSQESEKPKVEAPPETDPFVLAVLEVKPATPEQWLQDVRALIQLNRPQLAKEYLKQFSAALPAAAELARLQARFGSAFFLQLSRQEALQPEGASVANAVMQAADARMRDAQRVAGLVDRLADENAAARRLAMADLVRAGPVAVPALVKALADTAQATAHPAIEQTLTAIGQSAVEPLIVALESTNKDLRVSVMGALGHLKSREAVPYLFAPAWNEDGDAALREAARRALQEIVGSVPSRNEALSFLTRRLDAFLSGTAPGAVDEQGNVTLWMWDAAQQLPVERAWSTADAPFLKAAQLARQRYLVAPLTEDYRIMYLVTSLELAKREDGYDDRPRTAASTPIVQEAAQAGTDVLEKVLDWALDKKLPGAAVTAIDLLGDLQDVALVQSSDGQPRLLVRALLAPHRRVQFAAARAIMKCDPQSSYPGSSYLPEVLGYLSASGGRRRVLIGDPRADVARTLAGYFAELGFDADTELVGRAFALRAFDSPDYVFALVGDAIDQPAFAELVQVLRRDPRTADMPIGLMARDVNAEAVRRLATLDALTVALSPPQTREDVLVDTQRLLQAAGRPLVSADERLWEASIAIDALAKLAEDSEKYGFYDLMRLEPRMQQALLTPASAAQASRVLGLLGSPGAQQSLVEFASSAMQPLADRQAAAEALRVAVNRRGLLLTRTRLQQQYDLYNASEGLDRGTQEVLASILDTLETPTRKADPSKKED